MTRFKFTGAEIDLGDYLSTVTKVNAGSAKNALAITGNANDNSIKGGAYADTITGGAGKNTLTGGKGNDIFIYGGGNDLITDYEVGKDTIQIDESITGSSLKGSDIIIYTESGSVSVKGGKDKKITVTDSDGNSSAEVYGKFTYNADKTAITLVSTFSGSLKADDYNSAVESIDASNVSKAVNIFGNAQDNFIAGSKNADKLLGNAGDDTLSGGAGNDTLTGGDGADTFIYTGGKDVVTDYTAEDSVNISGEISGASLKSSDMVFTIGKGSLTLKNAKNIEVAIGDEIYYNNLIYDSDKTAVTLGAAFSGSLKTSDYSSTVHEIDASALSKAVNIAGNDADNLITGGKGADTLNGGAGDDTLIGGAGNDVFVYSEGDDVIMDYTAGKDKIKISKIESYSVDGDDVIFNTENGSLTVKDIKDGKITLLDANNKTSYWFADSEDFVSANAVEISSLMGITENNYSVEDIQENNFAELDQENKTIITAAK